MLVVKTYNIPNKVISFKLPNNILKHCNIYKETKVKQASLFAWYCLSQYVDLTKVKFSKNGKPYLINNKKYFSLSHSFDKVAIAICDKPIGIDIEVRLPLSIVSPLASRLLKAKDLKDYHKAKDQPLWFTKYWTKYEAFNKKIGGKLSFNTFKQPVKGKVTTKVIKNLKEKEYIMSYII